jgi:hypothetical protein
MEIEAIVAVILLWLLATCPIGYWIGKSRGRANQGVLFGLLLGPIGWIGTFLLFQAGRKCPECKRVAPTGVHRCKHCGASFLRSVAMASDPSKFFVFVNDKVDGPFTLNQLRYLISGKTITHETLCARADDDQWFPLGELLSSSRAP